MYVDFIFTFKLDNDQSSIETLRIFPDNCYFNIKNFVDKRRRLPEEY